MKTFSEWLIERKQIPLYHGTTMGPEDSYFKSFKDTGIQPHSAKGYGQGSGFYSFDDRDSAIKQADQISKGDLGFFQKQAHQNATPMVVRHQAILNPRDYDLDKEVHGEKLYRFLNSNRFLIKKALKDNPIIVPDRNDEYGAIAGDIPVYDFNILPKGLQIWMEDLSEEQKLQKNLDDGITNIFLRNNDTRDAADFNNIFTHMLKAMPELQNRYKSFLRSIQKKAAEGKIKGMAWKYIGDKPLEPDAIAAKQQNKWSVLHKK